MGNDMRKLVKALEQQGYEVAATKGGHFNVTLNGKWVATLASTPSDWRAFRNNLSKLRRSGFIWPPRK